MLWNAQYEMFQHDYMNVLPDMDRYGEYFATHEEYIRKYRYGNAFHPFHGVYPPPPRRQAAFPLHNR